MRNAINCKAQKKKNNNNMDIDDDFNCPLRDGYRNSIDLLEAPLQWQFQFVYL